MRLELGSLVAYGGSLTDDLQGFPKNATDRARAPSRTKLPFSPVRSMTRILLTRMILGAIAFGFGAAMYAQAEGVTPPPFEPSRCAALFRCSEEAAPPSSKEVVPPTSQNQVGTTQRQEAPPATNPRAAQPASFAAT